MNSTFCWLLYLKKMVFTWLKFISFIIVFLFIGSIFTQVVHDGFYDEERDPFNHDHLYSKIDCKVGDKHHYVMATQSSFFNDSRENIQIKSKLELECLQKVQWLNETNGQFKPGQVFEVRIRTLQPIRNNSTNSQKDQLQMESLFVTLQNLENSNNKEPNFGNRPKNIRLGAVNSFFSEIAAQFSKWFTELLEKIILMFQEWVKNKSSTAPVKFSWNCEDDNSTKMASGRQKREDSKPINLNQFIANYSDMFKHPFKFIQLEDGSIQNIQLSKLDTYPNVIQYKKFIARAFATQLDERKKTVLEQSELGTHYCHYQIEYDEPDSERISSEQYMYNRYRNQPNIRRHRSPSDDVDEESKHMVSVVRQYSNEDVIKEHYNNKQQAKRNNIDMTKLDFNVQEVQLIRDNMIIASGGYFQGLLAYEPKSNRIRRDKILKEHIFDKFLREHLDLNMQYSMVKLGDNRRKRSDIENDSGATINYTDKIVKLFSSSFNVDYGIKQTRQRTKRDSIPDSLTGDGLNKVVCQKVSRPEDLRIGGLNIIDNGDNNKIEKENNVDKRNSKESLNEDYLECYEYKRFGSEMLNANFNRSIIMRNQKGKSLENFRTKYKVGAKFFNIDLFMGKIDLSKNEHDAKLTLNLFGSEYTDLNLCDIRDKEYSQSDSIPFYMEDIWFITNVGLKIKYKLDFKLDIPNINCHGRPNNHQILSRTIDDQLKINQQTKMELGAVVETKFLILNAEMKIDGQFDMNSLVDLAGSCPSIKSHVKPINVSVDMYYEFYHPICSKWMMDHWKQKLLSWKLSDNYQKSWVPNVCI